MTPWTPFTVAVVTNAMPSTLAVFYTAWVNAHPEKANRLAEIVDEERKQFRDAVSANPLNLLDTAVDTVPNVGLRHAINMAVYELGIEMGYSFDASAYDQVTRAQIWLRMVQNGTIPIPCDPELRGGTPSYWRPDEREPRPARCVDG